MNELTNEINLFVIKELKKKNKKNKKRIKMLEKKIFEIFENLFIQLGKIHNELFELKSMVSQ